MFNKTKKQKQRVKYICDFIIIPGERGSFLFWYKAKNLSYLTLL